MSGDPEKRYEVMLSEIRISHYDLVSYELGVPGIKLEENEGKDDKSQMAGCCTEIILKTGKFTELI